MPSPTDFRKAFHLSKGDSLAGGFTVEAAQVGHVVKQQNERYEFPSTIKLRLAEGASRQQALAAFCVHVREHCIVHSAYGSPYDCSFGPPKLAGGDGVGGGEEEGEDEGGGTVTIACLGKAVRRRDIPTLKEAKEKEREEAGQSDELSPEEEQLLKGSGLRVTKSRFGTSKCSACGGGIDPGVRIAKAAGAAGRGGWAHVCCALAALKPGKQGPGTPKKREQKAAAEAQPGPGKASKGRGEAAAVARPEAEATEGGEGADPAAGGRGRKRQAAGGAKAGTAGATGARKRRVQKVTQHASQLGRKRRRR